MHNLCRFTHVWNRDGFVVIVFMEFNWISNNDGGGIRGGGISSKIREKSELERVRGVGNGTRFFFFLPSPFSRFSSTIVEVSYIFTHALSGYVSWLHRYLVNVTVDLPWKRILLPNGAGWRMGERWREIWDFNRRRLSISLFFLFFFFEFGIMRVDEA